MPIYIALIRRPKCNFHGSLIYLTIIINYKLRQIVYQRRDAWAQMTDERKFNMKCDQLRFTMFRVLHFRRAGRISVCFLHYLNRIRGDKSRSESRESRDKRSAQNFAAGLFRIAPRNVACKMTICEA